MAYASSREIDASRIPVVDIGALRRDDMAAAMGARQAVREQRITGDRLRLDTTAVETNIHWR